MSIETRKCPNCGEDQHYVNFDPEYMESLIPLCNEGTGYRMISWYGRRNIYWVSGWYHTSTFYRPCITKDGCLV